MMMVTSTIKPVVTLPVEMDNSNRFPTPFFSAGAFFFFVAAIGFTSGDGGCELSIMALSRLFHAKSRQPA